MTRDVPDAAEPDEVARVVESQREFYDLRAPDFGDWTVPDRKATGFIDRELSRALFDEFAPTGDVLELACGNGAFTSELVRYARRVTAVDASPTMLERNRREVGDPRVSYVHADLFEWEPTDRYDAVFFGFWLSHVPPTRFDRFWELVRSCLRPGGRVAFIDEDDRASSHDDVHVVDGLPVAPRTLRDGRRFDIVKLFWNPTELESSIRALGWDVSVRPVGETFLYGIGTP